METDWPTIAVIVAIGGLLWRQIATLTVRVDALGVQVGDIDRRLARLEDWIEGERAGRNHPDPATATQD